MYNNILYLGIQVLPQIGCNIEYSIFKYLNQ